LAYYAEIYPWRGRDSGELRVEVVGQGERVIVRTPPRPLMVDSAGGLSRGSLDLTGLPEGAYRLRLAIRLGDSTVGAEAPFAMAGLAALAQQNPPPVADVFETADEARLDTLYGPLLYLLEREEQGVYTTLSVEGKRRFLRQFWRRRDPTPNDPENPAMADFYRGVAYVNGAFREGGAAQIPGWRTDRGRIFLKYGRWDAILQRPSASPRPYEVWKFTRGSGRYYVFQDQSGFGHYVLIGTNDRREAGQPNWSRLLSREGAVEVMQFLGISNVDPGIDR
jgi:GWxTD domain-containing protein